MYEISVDRDRGRVAATWGSLVTDKALMEYQKSVWGDPSLEGFDELIDFRALEKIEVSTEGIEAVAAVAASMDTRNTKSRFAIVVGSSFSFGLSRMYQSFRSFRKDSTREVMVFMGMDEALAWLDEGR